LPGVFVSLTDAAVLDFVLEKSGLKKSEIFLIYNKDRKTGRKKERQKMHKRQTRNMT
jgi:hypothetical protein